MPLRETLSIQPLPGMPRCSDEHVSPIKTPKQLAIVLALAFLVPIALFLLLSQLITGVKRDDAGDSQARVLARIKPVGEVTLASGADAAPATAVAAPTTAAVAAPLAAAASAPAAKAGAPLDLQSGQAMMQKDGCAACHAVDKAIVGPAYSQVAAKYRGDKSAATKLEQKVKAGGSGVWGPVPMPPNAAVPDADIKALVSWILIAEVEWTFSARASRASAASARCRLPCRAPHRPARAPPRRAADPPA